MPVSRAEMLHGLDELGVAGLGVLADGLRKPVGEPTDAPGRTLTPLVRDGHTIAVVSHTAAVPDLERAIGAAVRLALENERLQAETLSQLDQLRASRVRIVETGDAERRQLERDLYDGAQQRLLALSYDLRLARVQAQADGDAPTGSLLTEATVEAQAALSELRTLAHGISTSKRPSSPTGCSAGRHPHAANPSDEGLVAAQAIRADLPQVGVLVLSEYVEPAYAMRLRQEHPERVGYLLKERVFDIAVVVDALRRIIDGETVIDPTIVSRLVGRRRRVNPLAELTDREREVLGLIAEGMSNRAIAARLFVTERTVEAHVTQIFQKLRLPESPDQHRRVLAVLAFLRS